MKISGVLLAAFLSLLNCSAVSSSDQQQQRSPRDRKTKSPGSMGCASPSMMDDSRCSPRLKRKKSVTISEVVSFRSFDEEVGIGDTKVETDSVFDDHWTLGNSGINMDNLSPVTSTSNTFTSVRNDRISGANGFNLRINPINQVQLVQQRNLPSPTTPVSSISATITKTSLEDYESPQSIAFNFEKSPSKDVQQPRPILKRLLTRKIASTIDLFRTGTVEDLKSFYEQGTQLPNSELYTTELFDQLLQTEGLNEKISLIYERDRHTLLDYIIMKASQLTRESLMNFANLVLPSEIVTGELQAHLNLLEVRVAIYLYAIRFRIDQVYKIFNNLLDDVSNGESHELARILLDRYYSEPHSQPLLMYAAEHDSDEAFLSIGAFAPEEITRLDSDGCSLVYHAAFEGNLDILEALKATIVAGQPLPGKSPLIATAIRNRDDSLKFFLVNNPTLFTFTDAEIEEAAFKSAEHGNMGILKLLMGTGRLNLYCHRGPVTLLSTALRSDQLGFAQLLVSSLEYNVNFVGEDPMNPEGHALFFLLNKYETADFFLDRGANRNIRIPVVQALANGEDGPKSFVPLSEYLKVCNDQELIKLFNKYS